MPANEIPQKWQLGVNSRYIRQNMENAMRGRIERGLVELITNSDDSYRNVEGNYKTVPQKIVIDIERRRGKEPNIVIVRDMAEGMNRNEMFEKLGGVGKRTSGFESGKPRRGLNGRGAKDIAAFGVVHFDSIKNNLYNHLVIPPSLLCRFEDELPIAVNETIRNRLGLPKGDGTVITVEVDSRFRIPQHETLVKDFSRYYSLRDIFSDPSRNVILIDRNKRREDCLNYIYPKGTTVFDRDIQVPPYHGVTAHVTILCHPDAFDQDKALPSREGILVKTEASIHDCTYFGLENENLVWRFTGLLRCEFIDQLIREYDDREEKNPDNPNHPPNNPQRLLNPTRDGLIFEHPFVNALFKSSKAVLEHLIDDLKAKEAGTKREVVNKHLANKLQSLSRECSKLFKQEMKDLDEDVPAGTSPKEIALGLHIIPPVIPPGKYELIVEQPKTFSVIVRHDEPLNISLPISVVSTDPINVKPRESSVFLRITSDDNKIGKSTFTIESSAVSAEAFIEARWNGYSDLISIKIVEAPPPPDLPLGLTFDKSRYRITPNRDKTIVVWLKTNTISSDWVSCEITSSNPDIVVRSGGKLKLHKTNFPGVLRGYSKVAGNRVKSKATLSAYVMGYEPATAHVQVEEHEGGAELRFSPDVNKLARTEPLS